MPKKKRADELTTDQAIKKIFPKEVVKELKRIVRESDKPKRVQKKTKA